MKKYTVILKPLGFRKLIMFSWMSNDALMHREGLKGKQTFLILITVIQSSNKTA